MLAEALETCRRERRKRDHPQDPQAPGVVHQRVAERQPFDLPNVPPAEQTGGRLGVSDWLTARWRWTLTGGIDEWSAAGAHLGVEDGGGGALHGAEHLVPELPVGAVAEAGDRTQPRREAFPGPTSASSSSAAGKKRRNG